MLHSHSLISFQSLSAALGTAVCAEVAICRVPCAQANGLTWAKDYSCYTVQLQDVDVLQGACSCSYFLCVKGAHALLDQHIEMLGMAAGWRPAGLDK